MNYNELKTSIAEVIRTNGNEEITGEVLQYVLLALLEVAQNGTQIHYHFDKTHDGQLPDVLDGLSRHLLHGVAAPEAELRLGIAALQGTHQVGAV
jgi:hypothetical protein